MSMAMPDKSFANMGTGQLYVKEPPPYIPLDKNMDKDPNGKTQHEAGAKLDAGKADCSLLLLFGRALEAVAQVGTFGARKYSRGGWQYVPDGINRYTAAMLRHLWAEERSPVDADSGLQHAAQVAWNALARLELILREQENSNG